MHKSLTPMKSAYTQYPMQYSIYENSYNLHFASIAESNVSLKNLHILEGFLMLCQMRTVNQKTVSALIIGHNSEKSVHKPHLLDRISKELGEWGEFEPLWIAFENDFLGDLNVLILLLWSKTHYVSALLFIKRLSESYSQKLTLTSNILGSLNLETLETLIKKEMVNASIVSGSLPLQFLDLDLPMHFNSHVNNIFWSAVYRNDKEVLKKLLRMKSLNSESDRVMVSKAIKLAKAEGNINLVKLLNEFKF